MAERRRYIPLRPTHNPLTGRLVPKQGVIVPVDSYWARRVAQGAGRFELLPVPAPAPKQPEAPAGQLIRELRTSAKLTQAELAETSGVDAKQISKIERGVEEPTAEELEALEKALAATTEED